MTGAFTYQLLKALCQVSLQQTTYAALIDLLPPIPGQHPRCEGDSKHCRLFTTIPHDDDDFFPVKQASLTGILEVDAGQVHGVAEETGFVLYMNASKVLHHSGSLNTTSSTFTTKNPQSTT
jgi:hypothetical protein